MGHLQNKTYQTVVQNNAGKLLHRGSGMVDFVYPLLEPPGLLIQHMDQHQCGDRDRDDRIKNCQHNDINENLGFRGHRAIPYLR